MKKFNKTLPYKLSRTLPLLGLAAGSLVSSCEKEGIDRYFQYYEIGTEYYEPAEIFDYSQLEPAKKVYDAIFDKNVRYVYLEVAPWNNYCHFPAEIISSMEIPYLNSFIELNPQKVKGKGDYHFRPGEITKEDSLWFVNHGWTINQKPIQPFPGKSSKQR